MGMDLGLVGSCVKNLFLKLITVQSVNPEQSKLTCTHNPFAIFTSPNTLAGFFKLEVLKQFNPIRILRVVFQAALSPSCKPFRKWSGSTLPEDGVYRNLGLIRQLHPGSTTL